MKSEIPDIDFDEVREIEKALFANFTKFRNEASLANIQIDPFRVHTVAVSMHMEVKSYTRLHGIPHLNQTKLAAYITYWLVKIKPISSLNEPQSEQIHSLYLAVNEEFALYHALTLLKIKQSYITNKEIFDRIIYALHYRDISCQALVLVMELLFQTVPTHLKPRDVT